MLQLIFMPQLFLDRAVSCWSRCLYRMYKLESEKAFVAGWRGSFEVNFFEVQKNDLVWAFEIEWRSSRIYKKVRDLIFCSIFNFSHDGVTPNALCSRFLDAYSRFIANMLSKKIKENNTGRWMENHYSVRLFHKMMWCTLWLFPRRTWNVWNSDLNPLMFLLWTTIVRSRIDLSVCIRASGRMFSDAYFDETC